MKFQFLAFLIILGYSSFGQSTEDQIQYIREVYVEVNNYLLTDNETSFIIDDTGPGGGSVIKFYSNGDRLYKVIVDTGYDHGGWYNTEYYFDQNNNPVFVFLKYNLQNYYGGSHQYKEERTYINEEIIKKLQKRIDSEDIEEIKKFKANISDIPNEPTNFEYSDEAQKAKKLKQIWELKHNL